MYPTDPIRNSFGSKCFAPVAVWAGPALSVFSLLELAPERLQEVVPQVLQFEALPDPWGTFLAAPNSLGMGK